MKPETAEQYSARILAYQQGRNPDRILATTASKLTRLLRGHSRAKLAKRPGPNRWCVAEIVAHLAEAELVVAYRIRMILSKPGTLIQAYDQDVWAQVGHYSQRAPQESARLFASLRGANLELWRSLKPAQWKLYGQHAERGKETIERIWHFMAGHDLNHLAQIEKFLANPARPRKATTSSRMTYRI